MLKAKVFLESIPTIFNLPALSTIIVHYLGDLNPRPWGGCQPLCGVTLGSSSAWSPSSTRVGGGLGAKRRHSPRGGEGASGPLAGTRRGIWVLPGQGRHLKSSSSEARCREGWGDGGTCGLELETKGQTPSFVLWRILKAERNLSYLFFLFYRQRFLSWLGAPLGQGRVSTSV